ncbi:MAG: winged helix-turn-helix domain-containing protein [Thermoplasmata archaeon]
MSFEISVVSNTPLTPLKKLDEVATLFLGQIGYLPKGYDPKTDAKSIKESVPYRLFVECLLKRPEKGWTVEQLSTKLKTTKPTIYRHLNKLKYMDLLEELSVIEGQEERKGYRIRYGNLEKAWNFVEAHVSVAMENYRKTVEHLGNLARERR